MAVSKRSSSIASGGLVAALAFIAVYSPAANADDVEQRLERIERLVKSQSLVDLFDRLESIQRELQELRGATETQLHEIKGIKDRQRELYLDIDRRLRQIERRTATTTPPPVSAAPLTGPTQPHVIPPVSPGQNQVTGVAPSQPAAPPVVDVVTPPGDSAQEGAEYRKAFNLLKEGRYAQSIQNFHVFLGKYPNSSNSAKAQYWLGEAHYVTRAFKTAIDEFRKVIDNYPNSSKVADAMLKIGYCYYELKDMNNARRVLTDVKVRFPKTTAARLAENRLQSIKLETQTN